MNKKYLIAAFLYIGLIWFLSSQPGDSDMLPWLPYNLDKLAHALEYAVLGFLLARGLGQKKWAVAMAVGLAALYGFSDEFHQSLVAARDASFWDWTADTAGAIAGVFTERFLPGGSR